MDSNAAVNVGYEERRLTILQQIKRSRKPDAMAM
jgi:hypothetical protein